MVPAYQIEPPAVMVPIMTVPKIVYQAARLMKANPNHYDLVQQVHVSQMPLKQKKHLCQIDLSSKAAI